MSLSRKKKKQLFNEYLQDCANERALNNVLMFDDYEKKVISFFERSRNRIERDIAFEINDIAANNEISYAEAKKLLNNEELDAFKLSLTEYLDLDRDNLTDVVIKLIEDYQSVQRISKLQAMNIQLTIEVDKLFNKYKKGTTKYLHDAYESNYYKSIYDLQRITGFEYIYKPSKRKIEIAMNTSWVSDNLNFDERIEKNKTILINELQSELADCLIRGTNVDEAVESLSKRINISKNSAVNLIQTELTAISSRADKEAYKELGNDEFEVIATLDAVTSNKCRVMDGKVFPVNQFEIGKTAPPFHWHCRSTTAPSYKKIFRGTRFARDESGNGILVIGDMTQLEWLDRYLIS